MGSPGPRRRAATAGPYRTSSSVRSRSGRRFGKFVPASRVFARSIGRAIAPAKAAEALSGAAVGARVAPSSGARAARWVRCARRRVARAVRAAAVCVERAARAVTRAGAIADRFVRVVHGAARPHAAIAVLLAQGPAGPAAPGAEVAAPDCVAARAARAARLPGGQAGSGRVGRAQAARSGVRPAASTAAAFGARHAILAGDDAGMARDAHAVAASHRAAIERPRARSSHRKAVVQAREAPAARYGLAAPAAALRTRRARDAGAGARTRVEAGALVAAAGAAVRGCRAALAFRKTRVTGDWRTPGLRPVGGPVGAPLFRGVGPAVERGCVGDHRDGGIGWRGTAEQLDVLSPAARDGDGQDARHAGTRDRLHAQNTVALACAPNSKEAGQVSKATAPPIK